MGTLRSAMLVAMGVFGAALALEAPAQQARYTCRTAAGSVYMSASPCPAAGSSNPPVYYGPVEQPRAYSPPAPGIGEAPDYITSMSPRCSALHDAMRTASARGLDSRTQGEMRRNYQRECAEDESEARSRWVRERGEKKQLARSQEESARRDRERSKMQQEQCGEAKRILVMKRQRTDLTEGEKAELQRFETNYKARCT